MQKDTFYFQHDFNAHADPKVEQLLYEMGWEGYGIYWALLEKLAQETGLWKIQTAYERIAFALRTNKECIQKVVESYGLFEIEEGFFYSKRLKNDMIYRDEKRRKALKSITSRWGKTAGTKGNNTNVDTDVHTPEHTDVIPKIGEDRIGEDTNKDGEGNPDFEKFWNLYGKKIDKTKCEKAFSRLSKKEKEELFKKLPAYISATPDIQYRKNPLTYLHGKNWNDEQTPGTVKYFGLLDTYDEQIKKAAMAKIKILEAGDFKKDILEDQVRVCLYKAIIEVETQRMTSEQLEKVRTSIITWRKDNEYASYQDTPLSVQVKAIEKVK